MPSNMIQDDPINTEATYSTLGVLTQHSYPYSDSDPNPNPNSLGINSNYPYPPSYPSHPSGMPPHGINPSNMTIVDINHLNHEAQSLDYLSSDAKFLEQKKIYLQDSENETLAKMLTQLQTTPPVFINHHSIRNILKTYFDSHYLKKLTETHRKMTVKGVFIAAVIRFLILNRREEWLTVTKDNFLEKYPEFENVESKWELLALVRFDRALTVALQYLQGRGNKQLLLSIGAHLEGSNMQYVTGGQPSPGTKRRVQIFERLSGVRPVKRAKRTSHNLMSTATLDAEGVSLAGTGLKEKDDGSKRGKRGRPPTKHLKYLYSKDLTMPIPGQGMGEDDYDEEEEEDDTEEDEGDENPTENANPAALKIKAVASPAAIPLSAAATPKSGRKKDPTTTAECGALDLLSRIASDILNH